MHAVVASLDERRLLHALRAGDESAYAELHERYDARLIALAMSHGCSRAVAQEAVQETWAAVVRTIHTFEGRSSLKTWIFRILVNRAKTRGQRDARSVPFSSLSGPGGEPAVDPDRFVEEGAWASPPRPWEGEPEERLLAGEAREVIDAAIAELPPMQRRVITPPRPRRAGRRRDARAARPDRRQPARAPAPRAQQGPAGAGGLPRMRPLACRELVELVTDYLEGRLSWRDRRRVERHLAGCDGCSAYVDQMRATLAALGTVTEESLAPEAREALLHAFRDWRAA